MPTNKNARIEEFVRLLGENQHRIFVYLMSMMHDRVAVEDVQQETNLVLWREFDTFEPNSNFAAWSCRVAFNQMRAWRKKQQRERLVFSDTFLEALAADLDSHSSSLDRRLDALEKCLERLPTHHRELIRHRYSAGSAIEEIAERMARKPDAIYRLLSRVRCSLFVDLSLLNASLMRVAEVSRVSATSPEQSDGMHRFNNWFSFARFVLATAAVILTALTLSTIYWRPASEAKTFASLDSIVGTRWISASVPTDTGSLIGSGRMKFAAGLVTIRFDVGAVLELEGPADLEIINPARCRLNSGKLLTTVLNDFKGFVVETPNAILTDQGTSFCVSVQQGGESEMYVLEGRVDVEDRTSGLGKTVFGKSGVRLSRGKIVESHDIEQGSSVKSSPPSAENRVVHLTTSMGSGSDYWVQRDDLRPGSEMVSSLPILLVKWSTPDYKNYDRKAYLKFDLSSISSNSISNASLHLNATPSGVGFASLTIDSSFAVYGITDDVLDNRPSNSTWNSAPASIQSGGSVDTQFARLLGKFAIPQGVQEGPFSVQSPELVEYLT